MFKKSLKITLPLLAILIFSSFYFLTQTFNTHSIEKDPQETGIDVPKRITLKGEYTCLPHRDTKGPQTLECALGIKGEDGFYYSLDTNLIGMESIMSFKTGDKIEVEGMMTPSEQLSSDHWQKYNIRGIISVERLNKI